MIKKTVIKTKKKGKKIKSNNNQVEPILLLKEVKSKVAETNSPVKIESKTGQINFIDIEPNVDDSKSNDNDDNNNNNNNNNNYGLN